MKLADGTLLLSATDLASHLACKHLTQVDLSVARGERERERWFDAGLEALWERGLEHEQAYVDHLASRGVEIADLRGEQGEDRALEERTLEAMRSGAGAIVQAGLSVGRWRGRADVLRRIEVPSDLGEWSYEVVDTKLAAETRATTILQLCLYSEMVEAVQTKRPDLVHVVRPGVDFEPESFRVADYLAYYRYIKRRLEASVEAAQATYPEPCAHCAICGWRWVCEERRHEDDHLSLVAGIRARQRVELEARETRTMQSLSEIELPLTWRPRRGSKGAMERVREQARVQVEARDLGEPVSEVLPLGDEHGFRLLPEPSPGDVFFDLEGDRFVGDGGIEYLFGYCTVPADGEPEYWCRWALNAEEEKRAFEELIDRLMEHWRRHRDFHIYHFSPYDSAALKRLMGRYATREEEVDQLLRGERFVDLLAVTRRSVRCGIERYSLKDLEMFSGFTRDVDLEEASRHLRRAQRAIELHQPELLDEETRGIVAGYNRDDCFSLIALRDWLEAMRAEKVAGGEEIPRPEVADAEPDDEPNEIAVAVAELVARLTAGVPVEASDRTKEEHARWLLAQLLDYHRREGKAKWWEYFTLRDATEEELLESRAGVAGLRFVDRIGGTDRCPIDRYRYPPQDTKLKAGSDFHSGDIKVGKIADWTLENRTICIRKTQASRDDHPTAGFAFSDVPATVIQNAIFKLGRWVAEHGIDVEGPHRAARNLLLRRHPNEGAGDPCQREGEGALEAARRWADTLGTSVLPIQGPPGSGKTYTGARMICRLVSAGKKVGITANSHKVIRNLLNEVLVAAAEEGVAVRCGQKVKSGSDEEHETIELYKDNKTAVAAITGGEVDVLGGTSWLWSRDELSGALDVLVVDEAGQLALANVLASSQAASGLVLLGDPQQLEQPQQGSHPEGCAVSALDYLLDDRQTLGPSEGLFLAETYRLHPDICRFSSEVFYEGRLRSRPGLEQQAIEGPHPGSGQGLFFLPVEHEGNQSSSSEEVDAIGHFVDALTDGSSRWRDREGIAAVLGPEHILVVAPYNDQVAALAERLPHVRVGTVDKFQGREAPVVVYSLATSSPEDAPRGMEFLYSPSRLNVATSRARAACILVGSPRVFEPECTTPRQMALANAFCRYLELAETLDG